MSNPFFPYSQPYAPPFNHHLPYPHNMANHAYMWGGPPPCAFPPYYAPHPPPPPPPPPPPQPHPLNLDALPRQTHTNGPGTAVPGTHGLQFSLPSGIGYVFSKTNATINLITANLQPWANPGGTFQFKTLKVPVDMTVADLIEQLCPERGPEGQPVLARGVVECIERGGGRWLKGHEFFVGEGPGREAGMAQLVGRPIKSFGWDQAREENLMPVWLSTVLVY